DPADRGAVQRRAARSGGGDLGRLPADDHHLPGSRPITRQAADVPADRVPQPRRSRRPERAAQTRTDAEATRRRCAGLLRPPRHLQRTYRGDQWTTGTPARLGPRVPQPHQLHRTIAPRGRRIPTPPTPWIRMSPKSWTAPGSAPAWRTRRVTSC